jgi:DnaD/phage-associated family protein
VARPKKQIVDYFPHDTDASDGRVLTVLQNKYGNDGYAFWFKLKELLGKTPGHYYDFKDGDDWEFLLAKTHISDPETARRILETLAILRAIDQELYPEGIIWSQDFVDSVEDVYKKRGVNKPERPNTGVITPVSGAETIVSGVDNTQSKVKETKVKEMKVEETKGQQTTVVSSSTQNNKENEDDEEEWTSVVDMVIEELKNNNIGTAASTRTEVEIAVKKYGYNWVLDAIKVAVFQNQRRWVYVQGVLQNWERDGKPSTVGSRR